MAVTPIPASTGGLSASLNLNDLLGRFLGTSGSTTESGGQTTQNSGAVKNTGTTTTSTSMSSDAMAAMLKSILDGTSGLAATALGEHSAGLYNSSTNTLLTNDLITRAAAQVAQNTKSQTVTQDTAQTDTRGSVTNSAGTKSTVQNPQIAPGSAAKAASVVGAISLVPKDIRDSIWQKIKGVGGGNTIDSGSLAAAGKIGAANDASSAADYKSVFPASPSVSADSVDQAVSAVGSGDATAIGYDPGAIATASNAGDATASGADAAGDAGGFAGDSSAAGYDPGAFDDAGNAISAATDTGGGFFDDLGQFFADGGLVDPNDKTKPVASNLDFSQHNAIVGAIQAELSRRSTVAGYADGGAVEKGDNLFTRRAASIDAQTDAAVNGQNVQVSAPAQAASAPSSPQSSNAVQPSKLDLLVRGLFKKYADGGVIPHYDDGGKIDLTNLGLQVQPTTSNNSAHLGVINNPTADDSGGSITIGDAKSQGTGFANTGNLSTAADPANGTTKVLTPRRNPTDPSVPAGESNSASPGTAQGGIDGSPNAVGNAALSLGLAALGLGVLTPIAHAINNVINAPTPAASTSSATSTAAADANSAAVGSVSVSGLSVGDTGIDGTVGSIGAVSDAEGMSGDTAGMADSNADSGTGTSDGVGTGGTASGGVGGPGGDSGNSASSGDSGSGDSGAGAGFAKGGAITGPGDETSDSVPLMGSSGEFMVNAEATARFRPFLEMINNAFKAR